MMKKEFRKKAENPQRTNLDPLISFGKSTKERDREDKIGESSLKNKHWDVGKKK